MDTPARVIRWYLEDVLAEHDPPDPPGQAAVTGGWMNLPM